MPCNTLEDNLLQALQYFQYFDFSQNLIAVLTKKTKREKTSRKKIKKIVYQKKNHKERGGNKKTFVLSNKYYQPSYIRTSFNFNCKIIVKVISFMNNKGGVGKTTSVQNVGYHIARKGYRTLLIDLDPQSNLSQAFGLEDKEVSIYECLSDENRKVLLADAVNVINENLHVIPSVLQLSTAEIDLINRFSRESILKKLLEGIADQYDFVFLDCPPSMGILTINALAATDYVFVPLQAEFFSFKGIDSLNLFITKVQQQINPRLALNGVFMTMYKKQQNLSLSVRQTVKDFFGDKLLQTVVRVNVALSESQSQAQPIFEYAPDSNGAEDYKALAEEILEILQKP